MAPSHPAALAASRFRFSSKAMLQRQRAHLFSALGGRVFYGWVVVAVASLVMFGTGPGQSHLIGLFFDPISAELGLSRTSIALAYGGATLVAALPPSAGGADPTGQAAFLGDSDFADFDGEAATVSSDGRSIDMSEELISPRIDCSGQTGVTLSWHHGYRSHVGQFVDVLVTLDGGTTFAHIYGDGVPDECASVP